MRTIIQIVFSKRVYYYKNGLFFYELRGNHRVPKFGRGTAKLFFECIVKGSLVVKTHIKVDGFDAVIWIVNQ